MSKGGGTTTTETKAELPDEFKALVLGPSSAPSLSQAGSPGSRVVGFDDFQNPIYESVGTGSVGGLDPSFAGILPLAQQMFSSGQLANTPSLGGTTRQALDDRIALADQFQTSFLPSIQDVFAGFGDQVGGIADIATEGLQRQLERDTLPTIGQGAINAGQFGSSRQGIAEGLATAEANRDIADIRAQILTQGSQQQMNFAPQLMQLLGIPSELLAEVGAAEDTFAERQSSQGFENLLRLAQLTQGFIPGSNQTQISTAPETSPLSTILGAGLAIGGMGVPGGGTLLGAALGG